MALHRLTSVTMGVPNVAETAAYYAEFGLAPEAGGWFTTLDAGQQLRIVPAPTRRLRRAARRRGRRRRPGPRRGQPGPSRRAAAAAAGLSSDATEPVTGIRVTLEVAPRTQQDRRPGHPLQRARPARTARTAARPGMLRGRTASGPASSATPCSAPPTTRPPGVLRRRARLQGQRPHQGRGRVHALLHRSPQRAGAGRPGDVPAPHVLAGRRHRRGRPRRLRDARGQPRTARLGAGPALRAARTSSGTSRTRRATSPSTTPTWTASSTTSCGRPKTSKAPAACSPGARPRRRRSCTPTTSPP